MPGLSFVGRDEWRTAGRPRTVASQEVIDALRQTSVEGPIGRVALDTVSGTRARTSEIAQYRRELNAAARVLGVRLKTQEQGGYLLFHQVPAAEQGDGDEDEGDL